MTLQQFEYIVAVDDLRHFAMAAERSSVTQPTLSMMIQKLEAELDIKIFDRSKQPVVPTEIGKVIVAQARLVIGQAKQIKEIAAEAKGQLRGELRIGIIPTLAPYLLPLFIHQFIKSNPTIRLTVSELFTEHIIEKLKKSQLDVGILVTPLHDASLQEQPLFNEEFVAYVSKSEKSFKKKYLLAQDIDVNKLWLLEEGHCFRSQIMNLCELRKASEQDKHFDYEAGSIETLKKFVENNNGITILPELATLDLSTKQKSFVRHFKSPVPVREVSLVTHRQFVKYQLIHILKEEIIKSLPEKKRKRQHEEVIAI